MEWLSCLASSFGRDLVCGAVKELRYPRRFNGFVDDLQGAKDKLITTKDSVNDRVEHDKKQAKKTAQVVHDWLEREANPLKDDAEGLLKKARTNKSCCFGHCPNWILRYRLAKKLEGKKVEVEKCIADGSKYIRLERVASLPSTEHIPWEKCLKFDSRQSVYDELMKALKDDEVTMIGLYGMGGCGKTTIAEELVRTAKAENLFDKVLFVPVSSNVEVRRIQDKIASALQFQFPEDGDRERAQRLCERFALEKRTLVILDDVWQSLDFGEIGISFGENHKNCKVMITTRSVSVCTSMDCQRTINLSTLTDEEAWELFQKQAHISENTPNTLKDLGRLISNECKGLPVAIAALAGTLKGKAEVDWQVALDRLRKAIPVSIEKGLQNPYKCLEVSYDNLDANEAKSLLLLCSVFPEDFEIPVEYLTIFAIGLGLVGEVGSFEGARNEVSTAKNKLISSSLLSSLFHFDEEECVKMHDLIRDVAHWIASKENKAIKCELGKDITLECSSIRYLWCTKFPNELDCSCIEFLCIKTRLEVSDEIFKGMERLRVLFLGCDCEEIGSLSTMSFKLLTNLRCLLLSRWELGDISSMGYMKKLESLMLYGCSFFELSDVVITQLTDLRLLHLLGCSMKRNPFEVIGRHLRLEELYYDEEGSSMSSDETERLVDTSKHSREVGTMFFELRKLKIDHMKHFGGLCRGVPPSGLFEKLEQLYIANCPVLKCLLTPAAARSLVQLQKLEICDCKGLKHILEDDDSEISRHDDKLVFSKLKLLSISNCSMLENTIPVTFARRLVQLESLGICGCGKLEYVFGQGTCGDKSQNELKIEIPVLESLELRYNSNMMSIFPKYCFATCPSLHVFQLWDCLEFDIMSIDTFKASSWKLQDVRANEKHFHTLETLVILNNLKVGSIFSLDGLELIDRVSLGLRHVDLRNLDEMKYVCAGFKNSFTFQNLKTLYIGRCKKLEVIFPASVLRSLPELKSLEIRECQELKQIIEEDAKNKKSSNLVSSQPCFPKLTSLFIQNCNNLKCLFYTSACNDLPNVEFIIIEGASDLEELIGCGQGLGDDVGKVKVELPKLKFLMLISLSSLCQGIELPTPTRRLVHNCPKLSLISSPSMLEEFKEKLSELEEDLLGNGLFPWEILDIIEFHDVFVPKDTIDENPNEEGTTCFPIGPDDEHTSSTEVHSTLSHGVMNDEESEKKFVGEVPDLDVSSVATPPIGSEHIEYPSASPLNTPPYKTDSHGSVDVQSMSEPSLMNQQKPPGETTTTSEIPQGIEEKETTTNGEVPASPKPILPSSSIEDKIKESVQEAYTSKDNMEAAMSAGIEGNGLGVVVVTHNEIGTSQSQKMQNIDNGIQEESNLIDKEGELGDVSKGSIEVHPEACADTSSNHLLIAAELEAFKHYADMDDAQIALLAEAIAVYPRLWKVLAKFSVRFQAWKSKTLADMLFFLRNESTASVTLQREKEFQELCDEAVQLGFDKPWVDEMRKRVMVRDPGVEHAKTRLNELLKRRDQLTQELCNINDEINNLQNFFGSQKKCFDFL